MIKGGYREGEPIEGAPTGYPEDHRWQIGVDSIVLERYDADAERHNMVIMDDSSASVTDYKHVSGMEAFTCPSCGNFRSFVAEGRWGDPLTLHCSCGATVTTPAEHTRFPSADWGRHLLQRLILCAADPAYEARRLHQQVVAYQAEEEKRRATDWYRGPDDHDVAVVASIDPTADDLRQALTSTLQPKLPKRHSGNQLTLLLVQVAHALGTPTVGDSDDGRLLAGTVRALLTDLQEEAARYALTRRPLMDHLRAWQAEGGSAEWQAAWDRTLDLVKAQFKDCRVRDEIFSNGAAALTTALYIIAREEGIAPAQVPMASVREMADPRPGEQTVDIPQRWEARLQALGHDLDDPSDPVATAWRHLRTIDRPYPVLRRVPIVVDSLQMLLGYSLGIHS
ncbi:hypothetical protein ACFXJ5_09205 [Streptomyces sp. NPDC059373]